MDKKAMQAPRKYFWLGVEVSREEYLKNLSNFK